MATAAVLMQLESHHLLAGLVLGDLVACASHEPPRALPTGVALRTRPCMGGRSAGGATPRARRSRVSSTRLRSRAANAETTDSDSTAQPGNSLQRSRRTQ